MQVRRRGNFKILGFPSYHFQLGGSTRMGGVWVKIKRQDDDTGRPTKVWRIHAQSEDPLTRNPARGVQVDELGSMSVEKRCPPKSGARRLWCRYAVSSCTLV